MKREARISILWKSIFFFFLNLTLTYTFIYIHFRETKEILEFNETSARSKQVKKTARVIYVKLLRYIESLPDIDTR